MRIRPSKIRHLATSGACVAFFVDAGLTVWHNHFTPRMQRCNNNETHMTNATTITHIADSMEGHKNADGYIDIADAAVEAAEAGHMGRAKGLIILASEKIRGVYSVEHREMLERLWPEELRPLPDWVAKFDATPPLGARPTA